MIPDQKIDQQPRRHQRIVHDAQGAGVHLSCTPVPEQKAKSGSDQPQPGQHRPLQRGVRQALRVAEQQPGRQHDHQRANKEQAKSAPLLG